jgi:NAD(P)-dependent dehydrogenase (short-subunit alcohol dehydrogenase family)
MNTAAPHRVAVVTGAGRGIGRAHALALAAAGYSVVVNDLGVSLHGKDESASPADDVVADIVGRGGRAIATGHDVSDWQAAGDLIALATDTFGQVDVVVNNAGIIRDTVLYKMTPELWDDVIRVHLRGTAAVSHFAAVRWRERAKAGEAVRGRLINTTSAAGLFGNVGQTNYAAAKAGIVGFSLSASLELAQYGVTANVIAPIAASRMLGSQFDESEQERIRETFAPKHVARVCAWLCSEVASGVTGRVFGVNGARLYVGDGWQVGPSVTVPVDAPVGYLDGVLPDLIARARPNERASGSAVSA